MAEYVLQEMNDLHRDGIRRLYPRMIRMREANYDMVVNDLHEAAQVPATHVKAVLDALPRRMMHWFSVNHSVKVDGFGLFTPNLSVVTDADVAAGDVNERNMNAENIKVSSISFRADSKYLKRMTKNMFLSRSEAVTTVCPKCSLYDEAERKKLLINHIAQYGYIRCATYCNLVQMKRTSGYEELRRFASEGVISRIGSGPSLMYVAKR